MEFVTSIICPGLNKSRLSLDLVDLNNIPADLTDNSEKFLVRISMIGKCKNLLPENRCNLTDNECIFRELLPIERRNFEEDVFLDQDYY